MASNLAPLFKILEPKALNGIKESLDVFVVKARQHELIDKAMYDAVLSLRGSVENKASTMWLYAAEGMTKDWAHFWRFVLVLMESKLVELAEDFLPSHFIKGIGTCMMTKEAISKLPDQQVVELMPKSEFLWATDNTDVKKLMLSIGEAPTTDAKASLLATYIKQFLPLESIHPADTHADTELKGARVSGTPFVSPPTPSKPVKPVKPVKPEIPKIPVTPDSPDKPPDSKHTAIIVAVVFCVATVIILLLLGGGIWIANRSDIIRLPGKRKRTQDSP